MLSLRKSLLIFFAISIISLLFSYGAAQKTRPSPDSQETIEQMYSMAKEIIENKGIDEKHLEKYKDSTPFIDSDFRYLIISGSQTQLTFNLNNWEVTSIKSSSSGNFIFNFIFNFIICFIIIEIILITTLYSVIKIFSKDDDPEQTTNN